MNLSRKYLFGIHSHYTFIFAIFSLLVFSSNVNQQTSMLNLSTSKAIFTMQEQKTQQFAKFYLKDIKIKLQKDLNKKNCFDDLTLSPNS